MPDVAGQPGARAPRVLFSLHDVAPNEMGHVRQIMRLVEEHDAGPVTMLVVPGLDWTGEQLAELRGWSEAGHDLAGHGWMHRCRPPRTLYHWLHATFLSRDVAEHLSLGREEIMALIRRNFEWFASVGLPEPDLYVPPAWAMGRVSRRDLDELPFRFYEDLVGVYDSVARRYRRLPLIGYEADTLLRAAFLKVFNAGSAASARLTGRTLRFSLHPYDLEYYLARDLRRAIARVHAARYADLAG